MKSTLICCLVSAFSIPVFFMGCAKAEAGSNDAADPVRVTVTAVSKPFSRVSFDQNAMQLYWDDNDAVSYYGKESAVYEKVEDISASSVSEDKKSASFGFLENQTGSDYLVVYPSSASVDGNGDIGSFSLSGQNQNGNNSTAHLKNFNLMSGVLSAGETSFTFDYKLSVIKFDFSGLPEDIGAVSSIEMSTDQANAFNTDFSKAQASETNKLSLSINNVTIQQGTSSLTAYMAVVPVSLDAGSKLTFTVNGSSNSYTYTISIPVGGLTYQAARLYDATVSYGWCDPDAPEPGPEDQQVLDYTGKALSNCYIVNPLPDKRAIYKIPVARVNQYWNQSTYETTGAGLNTRALDADTKATIGLMWQDTQSLVGTDEENSIILSKTSCTGPDDYFEITVPAGYTKTGNFVVTIALGTNAVIDGTANSNSILWSYHFWVTDYNPYKADGTVDESKLTPVNGTKMMDRNIGARSAAANGNVGLGALYYQFGRKDPFPAKNGITLYDIGNNTVTYTESANLEDTNKKLYYSVRNPLRIMVSTSGNWNNDKYFTGVDTPDAMLCLWGDPATKNTSSKSIFDPSPWGFMVPPAGVFADFDRDSQFSDNNLYYDEALLFAAAGRRFTEGKMDAAGGKGFYWTATRTAADACTALYFNANEAGGSLVEVKGIKSPSANTIRPIKEIE